MHIKMLFEIGLISNIFLTHIIWVWLSPACTHWCPLILAWYPKAFIHIHTHTSIKILLCTLSCCLRSITCQKAPLHKLRKYGHPSVFILSCCLRSVACQKDFQCTLHEYGLSPVHTWCCFSWLCLSNALLHTLHEYAHSPLCMCWCCLLSVRCLKAYIHTLHEYRHSPVYTHRWCLKGLCSLNALSHTPHMYKHPLYTKAHVSLHYSDNERPYLQTSHDMNAVHCVHECVWWDYQIAWILQYVHHISKGILLYV
jgi:hypothetical protein